MFNPIDRVLGWFSHDIGIDLGTANTLVTVKGKGIVIDEPSIVAIDKQTRKIKAVGADAKRMVGRTPAHVVAIRPLRDGVISDFETTERMLKHFIRKVHDRYSLLAPARPRVVVGIPSGVTEVEKRAVHDAVIDAGAREAYLISEPIAAALGAGLPIGEGMGYMIVDIGGGTTEVAVISWNGIVASTSIRVAGDELDQAIIAFAHQRYNLLIGERTAEEIKIEAASAYPLEEEIEIVIRGRDVVSGLPKAVKVSSIELRDALAGPISSIVEAVKDTIEVTPPELVTDLMERGITLAGGGALLKGLDQRLAQETKYPVYVAAEPLKCVVYGTGEIIEDMERTPALREVLEKVIYRKPPAEGRNVRRR